MSVCSTADSVFVYLLLGGNQGDVSATFRNAQLLIEERVGKIVRLSGEYVSRAWGMPAGTPDFLNKAICVSTSLEPLELLKVCKGIEQDFGRAVFAYLSENTAAAAVVNAEAAAYLSRPIDIDIIFYGNMIYNNPQLFIPHPLASVRKFVLEPLNEICPDYWHPVLRKT
ncbi:MAG: 2-amino-4-hydroxy-6-hydroxymethyldihydropteridine diphosphokinase, partial [Bacteroidales bacterium]|nr:2-amino-4-hydroxy-6-hydroxymethyldihydropteridine diphosphokinase [Bacteroidales bacterium]